MILIFDMAKVVQKLCLKYISAKNIYLVNVAQDTIIIKRNHTVTYRQFNSSIYIIVARAPLQKSAFMLINSLNFLTGGGANY